MNPSAIGWIKKLLTLLPESTFLKEDKFSFYNKLKQTGFIYGSNISTLITTAKSLELNEEERCKINLLSAFYYIYTMEDTTDDFVPSIIEFYKAIDEHKRSFLQDLFGEPKSDRLLEKIIHKRIHIDDNLLTKNFNYFLINAFLFIDIIGYHHFLQQKSNTKAYVTTFESKLETIVFTLLNSKVEKSNYDKNLIKLFEASVRHKTELTDSPEDIAKLVTEPLEKLYVLDTVCMASWTDKHIDSAEYLYLDNLKIHLQLDDTTVETAIKDLDNFFKAYRGQIAFLSHKNLAQSFYDNSSNIVSRLIKRNSKRLTKELQQSKEALTLLAKSTHSSLTEEEQKKIQNQLLDIFKSIPSLAIFMLPGGMVLLPLFIKFIPKLLPSAFDENRIEDKT